MGACLLEDFKITGEGWKWRAHIGPGDCGADRPIQYRYEFKIIKASGLLTSWTDYRVTKYPAGGGWTSNPCTWVEALEAHVCEDIHDWDPTKTVQEEGLFKARISFDINDDALGPLQTESVVLECLDRDFDQFDGCWPNLSE